MSCRNILLANAVFVLVSIPILAAHVYAQDEPSFGIVLSDSCRTFLENNLTTTCPSYQEIMTIFPDTSAKNILGDFGFKNGLYQRLPSNYKNPSGYYNSLSGSNQNLMFVDPPIKLWPKLKIIEIRPSLDEFILRTGGKEISTSYNSKEHSLTLGFGRYVDSCRTAYLDSNSWIFLTGDSLLYMRNNCDGNFTNFNSTKTTYFDKITHDISTSYKFKLEKWVKESIQNCGNKVCFYEKNQTGPP